MQTITNGDDLHAFVKYDMKWKQVKEDLTLNGQIGRNSRMMTRMTHIRHRRLGHDMCVLFVLKIQAEHYMAHVMLFTL